MDLLFQSLILSVFTYAIEVWGCAFYSKYLSRIDKLFARCYKLDYCLKQHSILDIRRDMKLWRRISSTNTALNDLLPPQRTQQMRTRSDNYILPNVRTSNCCTSVSAMNASGHQCKEKMSGRQKKVNENSCDISSIKKFLGVSRCSHAKQRQRNVQKKCVLHVQSCFFFAN